MLLLLAVTMASVACSRAETTLPPTEQIPGNVEGARNISEFKNVTTVVITEIKNITTITNQTTNEAASSNSTEPEIVNFAVSESSGCGGRLQGLEDVVRPGEGPCEVEVAGQDKDACQASLELAGWDQGASCEQAWLEAAGRLECGPLSGFRTYPLSDLPLKIRILTRSGSVIIRRESCNMTSDRLDEPLLSGGPVKGPSTENVLDRPNDLDDPGSIQPFPPFLPEPSDCNSRTCPGLLDCPPARGCSSHPQDSYPPKDPYAPHQFPSPDPYPPQRYPPRDPYPPQQYPSQTPYPPHQPPYPPSRPVYPDSWTEVLVQSPGYPGPSPPDCFATVDLPPSCDTVITFLFFDAGQPLGEVCSGAWLDISGYRFCGCLTGLVWRPPPGPLRLSVRGPAIFALRVSYTGLGRAAPAHPPAWQCRPQARLPCPRPPCRRPFSLDRTPDIDVRTNGGQCSETLRDSSFIVRSPSTQCSYTVQKSSPSVCGLSLRLEDVELDCSSERLYIAGQYYCGALFKRNIMMEFTGPSIEFRYEKQGNARAGRFAIFGSQMSYCPSSLSNRASSSMKGCSIELRDASGIVKQPSSVWPPVNNRNLLSQSRPTATDCTYIFSAQRGICWVRLDFSKVLIPSSQNCQATNLRINGVEYCGVSLTNTTRVLQMTKAGAELQYRLPAEGPTPYWSFRYDLLPCTSTNNFIS